MSKAPEFSAEQRSFMLRFVREYAQSVLEGREMGGTALSSARAEAGRLGLLCECGGVFVTYDTRAGALRGCIGQFFPEDPLFDILRKRAKSALQDSRFAADPITADEFRSDIEITVSVLTPMVPIADPLREVVVGVHGIYCRKGYRSGTYLPQVATDMGWDTETFCAHLVRHKAGIPSRDPCHDPSIEWFTYTSTIVSESHH